MAILSAGEGDSGRLIYVVVIGFILSLVVHNRLSLYLRRRSMKKQNGCQPMYAWYPWVRATFGLNLMKINLDNAKSGKFLDGNNERYKELGTTWGAYQLSERIFTTIEPENVKTILSLKFKDYGFANRTAMKPLLGLGIFTTDGERWAHSRALVRPNFAKDQVANLEAFEGHVQELFKKIPKDGSTFDLQELFFRLTIDSATEFLFGESIHSQRHGDGTGFAWAFNQAQYEMVMRFRMGIFHVLRDSSKSTEAENIAKDFVDKFVDGAIKYREEHDMEKGEKPQGQKYTFLYELAKATGDKTRLRDELMNILLAGRDTTASLLSNMFFEIAKRPHVWAKLKAEVDQLNGELPTYEQLRNMKYLKYCMNESLRIHPVVPLNSRVAVNDTILPLGGGPDGKSPLFVPKGWVVGYSTWAMHRRTDYFGADAEEWKPERWENLRTGWEYLPFNGGPRICLGQQYALTEAGYVTTRLLQLFKEIESRDPGPWVENLTLTICNTNGTKVGFTPA